MYVDNDKENFEFYNQHLTEEQYIEQWRKSLLHLHKTAHSVLLPTYCEHTDGGLNLQGYAIYPYRSAWVLIDSGVYIPKHTDPSDSYKYLSPVEDELPSDEKEWQSHWWLTEDDLDSLASDIGLQLTFDKGAILSSPLECRRDNDSIDVYADRTRFNIDLSTFENSEEVRQYCIDQIKRYVHGDRSVITIPVSIIDKELVLYSFFDEGSSAYVAQSAMRYNDGVVDFDKIESWIKKYDDRPYITNKDPLIYGLHARYTPGTITNLLDIL